MCLIWFPSSCKFDIHHNSHHPPDTAAADSDRSLLLQISGHTVSYRNTIKISMICDIWKHILFKNCDSKHLNYLLLSCDRKRKEQKSEVCQTDPGLCPSPTSNDVYNVIRSQKDDDLVSARPTTKNTSFLSSSPDTPTGDYDNLGGRDTESGFVTLASTESCFLNMDLNDLSLGRRITRDFYDTSLGRPGKRELNDGSLGRTGHREFYDRSLGRRTTKSEHFGSSVYGDHGLYDGSVRAASDLYDPKLRPGGHAVKADLYQTYISNGKEDTYQSSLGNYANRKSFQSNLDTYRNGLNYDSGRRYFNEQDWINRHNYWSSQQLFTFGV